MIDIDKIDRVKLSKLVSEYEEAKENENWRRENRFRLGKKISGLKLELKILEKEFAWECEAELEMVHKIKRIEDEIKELRNEKTNTK